MKFHELNQSQQSDLRSEWARVGAAEFADVSGSAQGIWLTWPPFDHLDGPIPLLTALRGGQGETIDKDL